MSVATRLAVFSLAALSVVGCGTDERRAVTPPPPAPARQVAPSGPPLTLDQYRDAANQICADAAEQGRALPPLEEDSSSEEIQSFLDATLALGDRTSEELQGLNPPAAQRDELREEFIRPFMEQLALAKVFMSVQRRSGEDSSELEPLRAQLGELRTERAEYAKANGLEACAT